MRRSTKAANYRTTLRLETLESRNVLSASGAFAMTLAGPAILQTPTVSGTCVVQTSSCTTNAIANAGIQLANSNDFPEAITSDTTNASSQIVVADVPAAPGSNPGTVVDLPTQDVGMPQSPIPDGVIQRSERFFPPLVLMANSESVGSPESNSSVDTPIAEFSCRVVVKLLRPEPAADLQAAAVVSSSPVNCEANRGEVSTPLTAATSSVRVNTIPANCEPVNTSPRGRASYRPGTPAEQPLPNSTAANLAARETAFTVATTQSVGFKPRRR
jgi:hypothetical protein